MPRGRPPGSKGKSAQFLHYNPKRWQPEFDLIVMRSVGGASNEEIGIEFGYTKEHISNILSTEKAREIKEKIRLTIDKEFEGTLKDRLADIGAKTIKHIENFVQDDNGLASKTPFAFIDRIVRISQAVGSIGSESKAAGNTTVVNGNAIIVNNENAANIREALLQSSELDRITPGECVKSVEPEALKLRVG